MIDQLEKKERLLLIKFICAFAWTDLEVQTQERQFIRKLAGQMDLDEGDMAKVDGWLKMPPEADEIDPEKVPKRHRTLFLDYSRQLIESDGRVDTNEAELFETLEQLLAT